MAVMGTLSFNQDSLLHCMCTGSKYKNCHAVKQAFSLLKKKQKTFKMGKHIRFFHPQILWTFFQKKKTLVPDGLEQKRITI